MPASAVRNTDVGRPIHGYFDAFGGRDASVAHEAKALVLADRISHAIRDGVDPAVGPRGAVGGVVERRSCCTDRRKVDYCNR